MENKEHEEIIQRHEARWAMRKYVEGEIAKFPPSLKESILEAFENNPDFVYKRPSIEAIVGCDKTIKSRPDLCRALDDAGLRLDDPEYQRVYDLFCKQYSLKGEANTIALTFNH